MSLLCDNHRPSGFSGPVRYYIPTGQTGNRRIGKPDTKRTQTGKQTGISLLWEILQLRPIKIGEGAWTTLKFCK